MSRMTFGRIGVGGITEVIADYTMHAPTNWSQNGANVNLSGVQRSASISAEERVKLLAWRDAMLGYDPSINQGDEPVVAITVESAPELNGWYKVQSVQVGVEPGSVGTSGSPGFLWLGWSASLEAVDQTIQPQFEVNVFQGLRPNSQGVTSGTSNLMLAVPYEPTSDDNYGQAAVNWSLGSAASNTSVVTASGKVMFYTSTGAATTTAHRFGWQAAEYSAGAAMIVETVNADLPVSWTWNDVSGSLTWNAVAPALTWDDVLYDGVS